MNRKVASPSLFIHFSLCETQSNKVRRKATMAHIFPKQIMWLYLQRTCKAIAFARRIFSKWFFTPTNLTNSIHPRRLCTAALIPLTFRGRLYAGYRPRNSYGRPYWIIFSRLLFHFPKRLACEQNIHACRVFFCVRGEILWPFAYE